jgi:type II secretory pathway component GspD/PulD (secretin)
VRRSSARVAALLLLSAILCARPGAERIRKLEFRGQSVADILVALAQVAGASIVADETVTGSASFYFADAEFDEALASFLASCRLYSTKVGGTYYVSRIFSSYDRERGLVSLKAEDAELSALVKALSRSIGRTVAFDSLPRAQMTVNIDGLEPGKALEILLRRFPEYRIEADAAYFFLKRAPQEAVAAGQGGPIGKADIRREGELYSLSLDRGKFLAAVADLFAAAGREYSLLVKADVQLESLYFAGKDFDSLLRLLLEQGSADYAVDGGVYYVFEIQRRDVVKRLRPSTIYRLTYLSSQDAAALVPPELASGLSLKADKDANSLVLTGSSEEVEPALEFLRRVDRPLEGRCYRRFDLRYLKARDAAALLPQRLLPSPAVVLPEGNAFVALLAPENVGPLKDYLDMIDRKREGVPVHLRYIKSDELLKSLPPSVSREDIVESGSPSVVFFVGSEDKRSLFLREKAVIDRPKPQLRYELLVIQHQKGSSLNWSRTVEAAKVPGEASFAASLAELMSLNFDVVSQFGLLFSVQLSAELGDSLAHVFADTTLSALSGQEVKFQNTSTYRYAEATYDADTKKHTYSGATREITSGLILLVNGWVSGDRMITMSVNATISKQGTSSSSDVSVLPPTTEKVVATQVRTSSGTPVVIGGLKQSDKVRSVKKLPLLGDIPLLGWLFRTWSETEEETEFVIYIVPYVSWGEEPGPVSSGRAMEDYYLSFVKGLAE